MTHSGPHRPDPNGGALLDITPENAGWRFLAFAVHEVEAGRPHTGSHADRETAIVTLSGAGLVVADGRRIDVSRTSVFDEIGRVVYLPPGTSYSVETEATVTVAIGSAPAEGKLPMRVFEPSEIRNEIRGGGQAYRQVVHTLGHPLPAERLVLYEVYVPRGTWSGWPPHCHDGRDGSPYLEETYYFQLDRPEGYAIHRNWRDGEFDDAMVAHSGDVVLVPGGYHTSVACPGSNMYFLNFLAGEPEMDERSTPPCFHADHTWIEADWTAGEWNLPIVGT